MINQIILDLTLIQLKKYAKIKCMCNIIRCIRLSQRLYWYLLCMHTFIATVNSEAGVSELQRNIIFIGSTCTVQVYIFNCIKER